MVSGFSYGIGPNATATDTKRTVRAMVSEYVATKDLPDVVREALKSVGYGRADIAVETGTTVTLSSSGGKGSRAFATLVNLANRTYQTSWGSWGGQNAFTPDNPVDNDSNSYPLPAHGVAIRGSRGGGRPVFATLYVPSAMRAKILPAATAELDETDKTALYCYKVYKGGEYRRDELNRHKIGETVISSLVDRGYLTRNRAGATAITTTGRNAVGDYRPPYR